MMTNWRTVFRVWRRRMKASMPYVRQREYRILQNKYYELTNSIITNSSVAVAAHMTAVKHVAQSISGEVCFFVTFAARAELKKHVQWHIEHLLRADIHVILVINTDIASEKFTIPPDLLSRLDGVYIRENVGFDFAAWAHLFHTCDERSQWSRLYLINDSIVGPLDVVAFDKIIQRIRASPSDFVGLTQKVEPFPHLQSFFLVFNQRALSSIALQNLFQRVISFPEKQMVIDVYEINLTRTLVRSGLTSEALFLPLRNDLHADISRDVSPFVGLPYVKANVLKIPASRKLIKKFIPLDFHDPEA